MYLCAMTTILNWLQRPFPFLSDWPYCSRQAFVGSGFVCFFLYVFRPFGMQDPAVTDALALRIGLEFGAVTFVCSLIWSVVVRSWPSFFNEKKWNVGREAVSIMTMIVLISIGNMLFSAWKFNNTLSLRLLLMWIWVTFSVGIFPTLLGIFIKQFRLTRRYAAEAALLNQSLPPATKQHDISPALVTLQGDSPSEQVTLSIAELLYIEADDNYVTVFFWHNHQLQQRILRSTLRRIEAALQTFPQVFRCHRTYLVNLDRVLKLSGNAQGLKLHLQHANTAVPVSRALHQVIRERLQGVQV
jgi:LytTr DNA-binding domain